MILKTTRNRVLRFLWRCNNKQFYKPLTQVHSSCSIAHSFTMSSGITSCVNLQMGKQAKQREAIFQCISINLPNKFIHWTKLFTSRQYQCTRFSLAKSIHHTDLQTSENMDLVLIITWWKLLYIIRVEIGFINWWSPIAHRLHANKHML